MVVAWGTAVQEPLSQIVITKKSLEVEGREQRLREGTYNGQVKCTSF